MPYQKPIKNLGLTSQPNPFPRIPEFGAYGERLEKPNFAEDYQTQGIGRKLLRLINPGLSATFEADDVDAFNRDTAAFEKQRQDIEGTRQQKMSAELFGTDASGNRYTGDPWSTEYPTDLATQVFSDAPQIKVSGEELSDEALQQMYSLTDERDRNVKQARRFELLPETDAIEYFKKSGGFSPDDTKTLNEQYESIYGDQQPNHYAIQNEVGQLESVPVPNSPADPKVITRTKAEEILDGRDEGLNRRNADSAVFERISALTTSLLNNPDLEDVIGGFSGSFLGQVVPRMATVLPHEREWKEDKVHWGGLGKKKGTGNAQALADIEALKNVSEMKGLRDLKGGGVSPGPVTEREWPKMGSLVANLARSQHSGTFRDIIVQLNEMAASALGDIDTTFENSFALPRPQGVTSEQWENMSNEDKTEYWTNITGEN
jgi:hypothetical protein